MQWHDYVFMWKQHMPHMKNYKEGIAYLMEGIKYVPDVQPHERTNSRAALQNEGFWIDNSRPYYNLYPSVAPAFTRIDLAGIKCKDIRLPLPQLLIRMPVGQELQLSDDPSCKLRTALISEVDLPGARSMSLVLDDGAGFSKGQGINHSIFGIRLDDGEASIESRLTLGHSRGGTYRYGDEKRVDKSAVDNTFRIVVALCLLRDNPDLIEPEPLEADREKWERTHDVRLLDKASRRGKRCWSVGKHIETAPGFRIPHFAIRWMKPREGLTATTKEVNREHTRAHLRPVLRPIKGSLVKREVVTEVPTDWLDTAGKITLAE